jgi:hypothetical protein
MGHLLKCVVSRVNVHILAATGVPITLSCFLTFISPNGALLSVSCEFVLNLAPAPS